MTVIGGVVTFKPAGYDKLIGIIERIVKMDGPCNPTEDTSKWTLHIFVPGNHPRNSGTFVMNYTEVMKYN